MSDFMRMRKPTLTVSPGYYAKPSAKVREWLEANIGAIKTMHAPQILQRVRAALGPEITVLNDADVDSIIRSWADDNRLPGVYPPGSPISKAQELEIVTRLKRVINAIPTKIEVTGNQGKIVISASGVTATINSRAVQTTIGGSWGGALQFTTQAAGVAFGASVSEKDWNLTLQMGKLATNFSEMENVFRKGEAALRGALSDLHKVDWSNPAKTKQIFTPYLAPVKAAVDAVSKTAGMKPGDISFGAWVGGDTSGGVTAGLRLTIIF